MFLHKKGAFCRSPGYLLFVANWIALLSSGSEINETQDVTTLMGQLFDDSKTCTTPTMELGFLVSGSYNEPKDESEKTFRKALHFVKKMAQNVKFSDSGTHLGLVVYGKKPYLVFDFNEYFDMPSLSEAIEEVKTPVVGNNIGEALSFTKDQLYDKSARPNVPKSLIVLMSKRSEDTIDHAVKDLKNAGVKIYTVGIGGESDPLEMSDLASDVQNTFVSGDDSLDSLVSKMVPKLCPDLKESGSTQLNPSEEPGTGAITFLPNDSMTADDSEAAMNPSEEPDPEVITVAPNVNPNEAPSTGAITISPNAINLPKKPATIVKAHALRKPITSHDEEDNKGAEVERNSSNDDRPLNDSRITSHDEEDNKGAEVERNSSNDVRPMNDSRSNHFDIFDLLSETSTQDNSTIDPPKETPGMNREEPNSTPQSEASPEEETSDDEESTPPAQDSDDNTSTTMTKKNTTASPHKNVRLKDLANKICSAKADIGILIDGSSSVTQANFAKLLDFTKSLSKSFSVSQDRTHIAVATASRGPHMSFDFEGFNDVPSLGTAISRISYIGGPFLLGSSLTGLKTSWFKNSGRKSIPQLLLVLAATSSIDDIVVPSRVMRDRGVRIQAVGIGSEFDGAQLKEIATHPAQDHVLAVSKYNLLPMIRPLLTYRMCTAVGGKLVARPESGTHHDEHPTVHNSHTANKKAITKKIQQLPRIQKVKQDAHVNKEKTIDPDMKQGERNNKLAATLKQLDQYKMIHKQGNSEESSQQEQQQDKTKQQDNSTVTSKAQQDAIEKEKLRKDIRRKLFALIRRLGGTKKDVRAAYRSIIYNINGHHDSEYCKDNHDLCKQWSTDNLCEKGNDIIDAQSVQKVCPKSCKVCF